MGAQKSKNDTSKSGKGWKGGVEVPEDGKDYSWMLRILKKLQEADLPDRVEDTRLGKLGISMMELEDVVSQQRKEWVTTEYLRSLGIAPQYLELCLLLYSYTLQEPLVSGPVNSLLNCQKKRSSKSDEVTAVMPWVKGVDTSLTMLPPKFDFEGVAYRGMKYVYKGLLEHFPPGSEFFWYTFKSFTTDPDMMMDDEFCGTTGERTIVKITNFKGKLISQLSAFPDESEVLGRPGSTLKVRSVKKQYKEGVDGDPFETADIIECVLVKNGAPEDALLQHCIAHIEKVLTQHNVSNEPLVAAMSYEKHSSMVTLNGPTKSGKSTLVNALLGQIVAPTGDFPCTVLPTLLYRTGLDEKYFLTVRGTGIDEIMTGDLAYCFDNCDDMFLKLKDMNEALRTNIREGSYTHMTNCEDWHFEVRLPGPRSSIVLCDCGGGSEGGLLGHVISKTLTYRVARAAISVLVVHPGSLGSLSKPGELENYLGANSGLDRKKCIIAVNKTDNEDYKAEAQRLLQDPSIKRVLHDKFPAEKCYFVSAKHLLSKKLLDGLGGQLPDVGSTEFSRADVQAVLQMWMPDKKGKYEKLTAARLSVLAEDITEAYDNSFDTDTLSNDLQHKLQRRFPHDLVEQVVLAALFNAQTCFRSAQRDLRAAKLPIEETERKLKELEELQLDNVENDIKDPVQFSLLATPFVKNRLKEVADFFDREGPSDFTLTDIENHLGTPFADAVRRNCNLSTMSMSEAGAQAILLSYTDVVKAVLLPHVAKQAVEKACEWLCEKATVDAEVIAERLNSQLELTEMKIADPSLPPPHKVDSVSRIVAFTGLALFSNWNVVYDSWNKLRTGEEWTLGSGNNGGLDRKFFCDVNRSLAARMSHCAAKAAAKSLKEVVDLEKESLTKRKQEDAKSLEDKAALEKSWDIVVQEFKSFHHGLRKR